MGGRSNSFDILRLAAALLVVLHHAFVLAGKPSPGVLAIDDLGGLGVGIFFVVSGHLIAASWERSAGLADFMAKRLLRILPGLAVALVLTAFVLGPLVTTLPPADYLARPDAWLYVARNLLLYPVTYDLPGVFAANPYPDAVNGSLWTLRLEFTAYLALALLGAIRLLKAPVAAGLAMLAALAFLAIAYVLPPGAGGEIGRLADLAARNGFLFLAGAYLHVRGRGPRLWEIAISAALLLTPVWILGLPMLVIALGSLKSPRLPGDISYGVYIYAFPLQQLLAAHGMLSFTASVAAVLPFAVLSWILVEKPALKLKARLPSSS